MGTFVITLREGFEATLIVGLILAYLVKTGQREHATAVWWGVAVAALTSVAIGATLFLSVGELEGTSEMVYEGATMIFAAALVTWMAFWMRKQAATIGAHLREQVSESLRSGGAIGLASVAFIAVAREGLETALFLFASTENSGPVIAAAGGVLGLAGAVGLGVAFYRGALRLDLSKFFTATSVLVIAFAAYLVFGGVHEFGEASGSEPLEMAAPLAALLYGGGFGWLYLRDSVRARRETAEPARAAESQA
ncbi:MAG TPA: FTR1 family protein [Solirubrobacterales bacterium]